MNFGIVFASIFHQFSWFFGTKFSIDFFMYFSWKKVLKMRQKSMLKSYKVDFGRPGGRPMSTSTTFWSRSGKCDFLMIFESCTKRPKVMQNGTGVPQRGPDSLNGNFPQGHFAIYPGIHFISTTLSLDFPQRRPNNKVLLYIVWNWVHLWNSRKNAKTLCAIVR